MFIYIKEVFVVLTVTHFIMSVVTQNLNTSSKQCAKVALQGQKNLEFPACLSCKHLLISFLIDTCYCFCILKYVVFVRHDFQFFNNQRLSELYEKEVRYLMVGIILGFFFFFFCLFVFYIYCKVLLLHFHHFSKQIRGIKLKIQ